MAQAACRCRVPIGLGPLIKMDDKARLELELSEAVAKYGEWVFDIPLPHGLWTRRDVRYPHTRLRRIVQIIQDTSPKAIAESRILDLGCLDGLYSVELALQGAQVVGIEAREANYRRALFVKRSYGLTNLEFIKDDVRNLSSERYGMFDIVVCSGILYHLPAPDVFRFLENVYNVTRIQAVIDTHVALNAPNSFVYAGDSYHGWFNQEHDPSDDAAAVEARNLDSVDKKPELCAHEAFLDECPFTDWIFVSL